MQIELTLPSAENKPIQNPYFLFFESNPQPMWLVDRETLRFIDVNAAAVRMYGYPREAFLRMSVLDIQAVDGVDAFLKAWYQFEDNSRARLPGEWNHISKSGSRLTVELLRARSDPYAKEELVICRDITARKQVEGCLAVRYALTRVLSEMPADATSQILRGLCNGLGFESAELWLADPRGATLQRRDTWSNPALQPLADVAPSAMTYLNPGLLARVCRSGSAVWTPQRSFQHGWADSAAHDPGIRGALCFAIRRRSENCGVIVLFSRGAEAPPQTMLDLLADIGAQIGLAIERSRTEDRLRVLSSVVEQSPVSILVTDLEGKIEYVNARTAELTGYPIAELVGRNPRILNSGETPAQVYRQLWATLANGGEWRGTFHNRRKNGELFWEAARIRPILDDSGKATHYLAVKEDITARKEMEAALKASEERFRMAATSSSDVIYEWDILSDRTQIFGGSRGQLGRSIHSHPKTSAEYRQMIHPDDRERLVAAVELHLTTGAPFSQEYRLVYPEGDVHYVSDEGAAVRDSAGNPYKWIGVIRDVTEQKMAELARAQLASIVESADAAIISRDLDGNVLTWNNGAEQIFGYSADEMIGRSLDALCPPDRLHESRSLLEKIRQGESVRHFETMRVTKDGRTIHVLTTLSPICDQSGALAGTSQVIWDVTERKRTELALAENEERLRLITENISEVVAMTDDRLSQWFYVSPTYERVTGRTLQSLYDDPMSFLEGIHPDDRDQIRESIVSRMARHLPLDLEFRTRGQDLTTRWFWIRAFPLMSPQIEGCRYVGVGVDTTHLKQLERQLAQSQKLESIGQLAAGIAHEINTPIQYIGDNGKFLESAFEDLVRMVDTSAGATGRADGDLDYLRDEIPHAIEQLLDGVSRVAAIVHAMKEFSHPGFVEKVPLDINRAIENTILVSRNEWKYCADLTTDLDPSLPPVLFVAGEFNQVILNLIVNAAHAIGSVAEKRGVQGSIHLKTLLADAAVEIRVADNGCGIPEEIRSKVFDPFFTTKPVGKGTGQGLAIAHSIIVQKHGGSIHLESEVGKGTTFVIRLPLE